MNLFCGVQRYYLAIFKMFKGHFILNYMILLHCITCQCNDVQRYFTDLNTCVTFYEESMLSRNFNSMEHCHRLLEEHSRILSSMLDHSRHSQVRLVIDMINQMYEKDDSISLTIKHPLCSSP